MNKMSVLKYDKAVLSVPANWAGPHMKMESTNSSTKFYKKFTLFAIKACTLSHFFQCEQVSSPLL